MRHAARLARLGRFALLAGVALGVGAVELRAVDPGLDAVVARASALRRLATGLRFVEGPVWSDRDGGFVVFSDIAGDALERWSADAGLSVFRAPSHQANGNARDRRGRLVTCEHATRQLTRTADDGAVEALATRYAGKRLNSPNDVAVGPDDALWFTDPPYGIAADQQEQPKQLVFRVAPDGGEPVAVAEDFDRPNGLCFAPDAATLYIADSGAPHHVRAFAVRGAALAEGRIFAVVDDGVPDGMRCDVDGRLWVAAGDGVHVFAPDGRFLGAILVPETPANLCFGGPDRRTLFITARTSLYAIDLLVAGAPLPVAPAP